MEPCIFPIGGNLDLSTQKEDKEFSDWLTNCSNKALYSHNRDIPTFKLWHLNGSLESLSRDQALFTFYELDQPTKQEINIAKNNTKILVSSNESKNVFNNFGVNNVDVIPLGFDYTNFKKTEKKYFNDGRITFNVVGKFEKRKHHEKLIKAWVKRFGGSKEYFLQCAIYNTFLKEEDNQKITNAIMQGEKPFNVSFFGFMAKNDLYNDFLNSGDIILSMSGGEGWGLPEFHSVALGKHSVILNAHSYKEFANEDNSVLVEPNGKIDCYDGKFFREGTPFNQGQIYTWDEDDFIDGCELAIKRVESSKINEKGLELQDQFPLSKTVDALLDHLKDM